jgi:hypothetical protein
MSGTGNGEVTLPPASMRADEAGSEGSRSRGRGEFDLSDEQRKRLVVSEGD